MVPHDVQVRTIPWVLRFISHAIHYANSNHLVISGISSPLNMISDRKGWGRDDEAGGMPWTGNVLVNILSDTSWSQHITDFTTLCWKQSGYQIETTCTGDDTSAIRPTGDHYRLRSTCSHTIDNFRVSVGMLIEL